MRVGKVIYMPDEKNIKKETAVKPDVKKELVKKPAAKTAAKPSAPKGSEKIYTIPLGKARKKPYENRAPYAIKIIREYLKTHTKTNEIKLGRHLNEHVWGNGIRKIPSKVRVKVLKSEDVVKAELMGFDYVEFVAKKKKETGGGLMEKMKRRMTPKEMQKQAEEEMIEGKKTSEEATKKETEKEEAKKVSVEEKMSK